MKRKPGFVGTVVRPTYSNIRRRHSLETRERLSQKLCKERTCRVCESKFVPARLKRGHGRSRRKTCSQECERRLHVAGGKMNINGGGYREGSGYGKRGRFNGHIVQSTWECAFIIWAGLLGKQIFRNIQGFKFLFEGKERTFFPDFVMDGKLHEVKGWPSKLTSVKIAQFGQDVKFWFRKDLEEIFELVEEKMGCRIEDLWKFYDKPVGISASG